MTKPQIQPTSKPVITATAGDTIGVMLPVRLETRVDPAGKDWSLRVIVIPDEPWINRHDPTPSPAEMKALFELWQQLTESSGESSPEPARLLESEDGRVAWTTFCGRVEGPRAAWLVRTFPPVISDGKVDIPHDPKLLNEDFAPNTIHGFPERFTLWAAWEDGSEEQLHEFLVKLDQLSLEFEPEPEAKGEPWWASWETALEAGLGAKIPLTRDPAKLAALYVVGIGDAHPAELFLAHAASGELAIIPPGTPTNTLEGEPAADLGRDPELWRRLAIDALDGKAVQPGSGTWMVSRMLTGEDKTLPVLPGDAANHWQLNQWMVQALWPALWGHSFKDIWGFGEEAHRLADWAARYLYPEGPIPAIRIDDQPYGILPTTTLRHWKADSTDPELEMALATHLQTMRRDWAAAARTAGNVVGSSSDRLMDYIARTATSNRYINRFFTAAQLLEWVLFFLHGQNAPQTLEEWWLQHNTVLQQFGHFPLRKYMTAGYYRNIDIPLVTPTTLPPGKSLREVLEIIADFPRPSYDILVLEMFNGVLPDSLLVRLALYARLLSTADAALAQKGNPGPMLEPIVQDAANPTIIDHWVGQWNSGQNMGTPAEKVHDRMRDALRALAPAGPTELERVLRATFDAAMHRIDPWVTSIAWRRLDETQQSGAAQFKLGVYGWVDGPLLGAPGPTEGGLLHTPSDAQTLAAIILRDKYLSERATASQNTNGDTPWTMNLDSELVRLADELATEVRASSHLWQALGRRIERIVGGEAAVRQLRQDFPIRSDHTSDNAVCHGVAALHNLLDPAARVIPISAAQEAALQKLERAIDVYGDLLVMEAVHHVVTGRSDVAGAAMDAAAGLKLPPSLEAIRTPRAGRSVNTSVLVVLPAASVPANAGPATHADPCVAAFVRQQLGAANTWQWTVDLDGAVSTVTLQQLALDPIDTVLLSHDELQRQVVSFAGGGEVVAGPGSDKQAQAQELVRLLGNQPLLASDIAAATVDETTQTTIENLDQSIRQELRNRYQGLVGIAKGLLDDLQNATQPAAILLHLALRWGVTPPLEADATPADRVALAAATLANRLSGAPGYANGALDSAIVDGLSAAQLATAIAELAAPEGQLAILSRTGRNTLVQVAQVNMTQNKPRLDTAWLAQVAPVRTRMAALEAFQLEASLLGSFPPLTARTNRADADPWQTAVEEDAEGFKRQTRLVAAYGPTNAWASISIAAGLIDSWSEAIPSTEHVTSAAFGFNAPAARAPQAILLATPPIPGDAMSDEQLLHLLVETRELAHARMARLQDLGTYKGSTPLAMLRAMGRSGIRLDASTVG